MASYAWDRVQEWLTNPDRIGGSAEEAHIARHGDCACLPDLWLPNRRGYSDLCALESCSLCDIHFYYASENEDSCIRRQEDEEVNGVLSSEWDTILSLAFLKEGSRDWPPYGLVVCGCCWDMYSGSQGEVTRGGNVPIGTSDVV